MTEVLVVALTIICAAVVFLAVLFVCRDWPE